MRNTISTLHTAPRLCLDHGVDEAETECLQVEEHGATFESPWQFEPLAELLLCLSWEHPRLGRRRMPLTGIVVDCRKLREGCYETVVLFNDLPEEHRSGVREFAEMVR